MQTTLALCAKCRVLFWSRWKILLPCAHLRLWHLLSLPCLEDFPASETTLGQQINFSRTIFLSWITKPFLLGGNNGVVVTELGLGRTDTRTLIWFRLKKCFYLCSSFCAKLYHHLKSKGMFCKILPRLLL